MGLVAMIGRHERTLVIEVPDGIRIASQFLS